MTSECSGMAIENLKNFGDNVVARPVHVEDAV